MIATLPYNTTTPILIGNNLFDSGILINYVCRRGGALQVGKITVINDTSNPTPINNVLSGSCGITNIEVETTSGTDISLLITVDNSSSNDVEFIHNVKKIYGTIPIPLCTSIDVQEVTPAVITLTFDTVLDETFPSNGFTVSGKTIISEVISGNNVILTVSEAFEDGDTFNVQYVIPESNKLKGLAGGIVQSFNESKTVSYHPDLELHASSIEWIDDTHIRVTYDWSDDDQLLDFTGLSDSGFTRDSGDNSITITNGTQSIDGIMWKQPIKCSRIFVSSGMPLSGRGHHLNIYTALSPLYAGSPWNANPSITAISVGATAYLIRWVVNGAYGDFEYSSGNYIEDDVPNSIEFIIANDGYDVTYTRLSDSSEHSFHLTRDLSSPLSVFGMIAFGAYQTDTKWKTITIEGEIELPE